MYRFWYDTGFDKYYESSENSSFSIHTFFVKQFPFCFCYIHALWWQQDFVHFDRMVHISWHDPWSRIILCPGSCPLSWWHVGTIRLIQWCLSTIWIHLSCAFPPDHHCSNIAMEHLHHQWYHNALLFQASAPNSFEQFGQFKPKATISYQFVLKHNELHLLLWLSCILWRTGSCCEFSDFIIIYASQIGHPAESSVNWSFAGKAVNTVQVLINVGGGCFSA